MSHLLTILYISGVGGSQIWRSDGTGAGTKRAFQKTDNDIQIHRGKEMLGESRSRDRFGILGNALYISGNINDLNVNIPKGGFKVPKGTNSYSEGFNQAAAVSDIDTPPLGNVTVTLHVDQGVIVIKGEDTGFALDSYRRSNLSFLLAISNDHGKDKSLLFNALLAQGHLLETVTTGEAALQAVKLKLSSENKTKEQLLRAGADSIPVEAVRQNAQYDGILMASSFSGPPFNDSMDGLQASRLIRIYESLMNTTRIPIYLISHVNEAGLQDLDQQAIIAGAEGLLYLPVLDYTTTSDITTFIDTGTLMSHNNNNLSIVAVSVIS
jgi:CheY-like chemotaxis protein